MAHEAAERVVRLLRMAKAVPADVREALAAEIGMQQNDRQQSQAEAFHSHGDIVNKR